MNASAIRRATTADAAAIAAIYNPYITDTIVTFEEEPLSPAEIAARIDRITATHPWLVLEDEGVVAGYAYGGPWSSRRAYRYTVETTVYVAAGRHREGIGTALYRALLEELRAGGSRSAIGAIALPNDGSVALHARCGFTEVGRFRHAGFKLGRWIDVAHWQLML